MDSAHRIQLVHRDLKPENIFLSQDETGSRQIVKVLDFGIAEFVSGGQSQEAAVSPPESRFAGTPAYASPEQISGESPDTGWDVWSLSVISYEALTGVRPFAGARSEGWREDLLAGRFTPVRQYVPDAPVKWQTFFERYFASERKDRPGSASVFLEDLQRALN